MLITMFKCTILWKIHQFRINYFKKYKALYALLVQLYPYIFCLTFHKEKTLHYLW